VKAKEERLSEKEFNAMKNTMIAVLGFSMLVASAFAAQDTAKTTKSTDAKPAVTSKVKKHKKAVKSTTATPAPAAASK
jgi:hypothetical protein